MLMRNKVAVIVLLIVLNRHTYGFWDIVVDWATDTGKDVAKDMLDVTNILSDIRVIQESQRDDINGLYNHFDELSTGEYFDDYVSEIFNYDVVQILDAADESSEILEKYIGQDIHNETEIYLKKAVAEVEDNITNIRKDRNRASELNEAGKLNLEIKQAGQSLETQEQLKAYEKAQAEDIHKLYLLEESQYKSKINENEAIKNAFPQGNAANNVLTKKVLR